MLFKPNVINSDIIRRTRIFLSKDAEFIIYFVPIVSRSSAERSYNAIRYMLVLGISIEVLIRGEYG